MEFSNIVSICLAKTPMQNFIENNKVLANIINQIPKLPFEAIKMEECHICDREDLIYTKTIKDENGRAIGEEQHVDVTLDDKWVYISKVLRAMAEKENSGFLMLDGFLHYFKVAYWEKVGESLASDLLALAAIKAGFLPVEAQREVSKKKLLNQFVSDYKCPPVEDESNPDNLKILINLQNGTVEYGDGDFELRGFQKDDMLRYQLSFKYDPNATCEKFDKFLDDVLPEKEAQDVLMEMIGYCFIPTRYLKLEVSMMLYGEGANGKGVIYELVKEILGKEHVTGFSMAALSFDPNTRAQLSGKLLNYSSELGGKCQPDTIKKLISGEDVEVKTLYKDVWIMRDYTCKFIFNTNSLPREAEANVAFFRRWIILPFDVTIPKERRDKKLPDKLKKELPGIFNRVIAGIKRLVKNEDFTESELVNRTLEEYKVRSNTVLLFIQDEGWIPTVPQQNTERKSSDIPHLELSFLYDKYVEYCSKYHMHAANNRTFNERIKKIFYVQPKSTNNATWVFCKKEGNGTELSQPNDSENIQNPISTFLNTLKNEESKS